MEKFANKITELLVLKRKNNKIFKNVSGMEFIWEMAANFGIHNIQTVSIIAEKDFMTPMVVINGLVVGNISREMLQDIKSKGSPPACWNEEIMEIMVP